MLENQYFNCWAGELDAEVGTWAFCEFIRVTWLLDNLRHPQFTVNLRVVTYEFPRRLPRHSGHFSFFSPPSCFSRCFVKARVKFNQHFPRQLVTFSRDRKESRKKRRFSFYLTEINFQFPRQRFVWRCREKLFSSNEIFARKETNVNFGCGIDLVASPRTPNGNHSRFTRRPWQNTRPWLECQDQIL